MDNNSLSHYGVPGMRWGIRKSTQSGSGKSGSSAKKKPGYFSLEQIKARKAARNEKKDKEAAEERARLIAKGKIRAKDMTDAELKERINRINMEKTYKQAMKDNRNLSRGSRFVEKVKDSVIDRVADNTVGDLVSQALKEVGAKGINKAFGYDAVFANNKKKN